MFKNVYYDMHTDTMHLWYFDGEHNRYRADKWVPYVYKKDDDGDTDTIYGDKASKIKFKSYRSYSDFQKNNKQDIYENNCKPEIQYLVEKYHTVVDDDIMPPKLKIYSIDIEVNTVNSPGVFPSPQKAGEPITAISIYDWLNDHVYVFGLHKYDNTRSDVTYIYCDDSEKMLLKKFLSFTYKNPPDVYTGWNISMNKKMTVSGFDFPYIINRSKNLFDKDVYKFLSPIKKVRSWESNGDIGVSISGVSILDYQTVYKWYTRNNLERYSLDYVCNFELNEKKLEYEGTLSDLYKNDWQKYIDYNIKDVELIKQLDDKLGYIDLIQGLSLLTRAPMESFLTMTILLEGKILTYYRRNNLCAPQFKGGVQSTFPAAYVKQPQVGLHDWISSIDIASSYPTAIITLNMSIETYIGRITDLTEDHIINYTIKKKFPAFMLKKGNDVREFKGESLVMFNKMIQKGLISVTPCGTCFKTNKTGVLADIERIMFLKRKEIKRDMKALYDVKGADDEIKRKYTMQYAYKVLLNSLFGITSVPYSRYFLIDLSEAITSCGRHSVKMGEQFTNDILNDTMNPDLLKIINEIKQNDK